MGPKEWLLGLNRIETETGVPITLQGGEPTVYRGFYDVIGGIKPSLSIDLLTNLEVDLERFREGVRPDRLRRPSPYASIRVSYHHGQSRYLELTERVLRLQEEGYHIGVFEVDHPDYHEDVVLRQSQALALGIDWRVKEFLGPWKGVDYGTMRYTHAVNDPELRSCMCRTSELLIDPSGHVFRCHSDVYANRSPVGHLLDVEPEAWGLGEWRGCGVMGRCNSCDIKVKTNRFQIGGHSSVEIKNVSEPTAINQPTERVENTYGRQ